MPTSLELDRDGFLYRAGRQAGAVRVDLPDGRSHVFVKRLTLTELATFENTVATKTGAALLSDLVLEYTTDSRGQKLFSEEDRADLAAVNLSFVNAVVDAIAAQNNTSRAEIDELKPPA